MPKRITSFLALLALSVVTACARPRVPVDPTPRPASSDRAASATARTQTGTASWYGPGFHGKPTASGEPYDQNALTAAHRTLPLGTRVRVTNLANSRSVEVRINDRGPFVGDRVIDLSRAAAARLDMIGPGTAEVRIEVLDAPVALKRIPTALSYTLQFGSFTERANAEALRSRVAAQFADASVRVATTSAGTRYRVHAGAFDTRDAADAEARRASQAGLKAMVVEK